MTVYRFQFEGNTPSKKNSKRILRAKSGRPFIASSTEHEAWHRDAAYQMKLQRSRYTGVTFPIPRCLRVFATLYYADRHRRDSSNTFESIMDLLVDAEIVADDCWAVTGPTAQFPLLRKDRPGWEVCVVVADAAPGPAAVYNGVSKARASYGRLCECGHRESEHEFGTGSCGIDFTHCSYFRPREKI